MAVLRSTNGDTDLIELEKRLLIKEDKIEAKEEELQKREQSLLEKASELARMTLEEAKKLALELSEQKAKAEAAKIIKSVLDQAKLEAKEKAKQILVTEMVHGANDYVAEFTVTIVKVPNDDVKGAIIGKEGRNIRIFEQATGVDVGLDEEGVIRLSCFDGVRREIARITLERLMADGRIQPARIEELVEIVRKEVEQIILEEGQKLATEVGAFNVPAELLFMLGKFKYRTSYGQNMISHTLEETKIGMALASEVGADTNIVRLGCLFHDIGKVVEKEDGSHITLGAELLRRFQLPDKVISCVEEHHEDKPFSSIESMIVYIADAISGSRPGARFEDFDRYVHHMTTLENICKGFSGVSQVWAYQAGRELRVLVDPKRISDDDAILLARDIKERIEKEVPDFPGQISITVIREVRVIETTR